MNYADRTLVALADPTTRSDVFDQTALEQIAGAGYDVDSMGIGGPFTAVFDDFRLAVAAEAEGLVDGTLSPVNGGDQTQVRVHLTGLPEQTPVRVDALWRGAVVARFRQRGEPITDVIANWPSTGTIDAEVAAGNGGVLPADPVALENARRDRFAARMQTTLDQPDVFDDAALDRWLRQVGAESVGDLLTHFGGTVDPGTVTVTFAEPGDVPEVPKRLPVVAALLVRDSGFSVADLLAETSLVRERLTRLGAIVPTGNGLRPLRPLLVIWIVPEAVFEDTDWPGATPALRRAEAGAWLAQEGIGLATTA